MMTDTAKLAMTTALMLVLCIAGTTADRVGAKFPSSTNSVISNLNPNSNTMATATMSGRMVVPPNLMHYSSVHSMSGSTIKKRSNGGSSSTKFIGRSDGVRLRRRGEVSRRPTPSKLPSHLRKPQGGGGGNPPPNSTPVRNLPGSHKKPLREAKRAGRREEKHFVKTPLLSHGLDSDEARHFYGEGSFMNEVHSDKTDQQLRQYRDKRASIFTHSTPEKLKSGLKSLGLPDRTHDGYAKMPSAIGKAETYWWAPMEQYSNKWKDHLRRTSYD